MMRTIRQHLGGLLLSERRTPEEEAAFRAHANDFTARVSRLLLFMGPVCAFLWWPTDFFIFPHDPAMRSKMLWWRVGTIVTLGPGPLLITLSARIRRRPVPLVTACLFLGGAMLSYGVSQLGTAASLWSGSLYLLPLTTLLLQVPLAPRLALTLLLTAVNDTTFFAPHPAYFAPPAGATIVATSLFMALVSTALGHVLHRLVRAAFFANYRLEAQVRLKTEDLRAVADRLETLREQERAELARELHDDVGQLLSAVRYEVDTFSKRARSTGLELPTEDIHFLLDRMLETFRRIVQALRPRTLDDFGFVAAAEGLVSEHRQRLALDITLAVTPPGLLVEGAAATAGYRVLQEALTNIAKYAQASRIDVDIRAAGGLLCLTVTDNGRGLPPRVAWRPGAVGIIGMRERARGLGGDLEVSAAPGGGTRVELRLPLSAQEVAA